MAKFTPDDLLTADERRRFAAIVAQGLTGSNHGLTAGGRRRSFSNLDLPLSDPEVSAEFVMLLAESVRAIKAKAALDQLAYVDVSSRGPHGLLDCRTEIGTHTGLRSVVIRPDKRLHVAQIDGVLNPGDRLLFLCDALTTGQTMARAFGICSRRQATVVVVVFCYDGQLSGAESLRKLGLDTVSLVHPKYLLETVPDKLPDKITEALHEKPAVPAQDLFRVAIAQL